MQKALAGVAAVAWLAYAFQWSPLFTHTQVLLRAAQKEINSDKLKEELALNTRALHSKPAEPILVKRIIILELMDKSSEYERLRLDSIYQKTIDIRSE